MFQDLSKEKSEVDKVSYFHYLIWMLLPILKQINQDQSIGIYRKKKKRKKKGSHLPVHNSFS
jgi:lysine-specific demethylase 3